MATPFEIALVIIFIVLIPALAILAFFTAGLLMFPTERYYWKLGFRKQYFGDDSL
jgi:hypothetical protein